ncbi:DPP IV N-terminal domain-containing protein [Streptomyces sp. NPDC058953]|uniref:S9 family peptidase n=1 Tax=unclassified Streptomyces TaxID=2593676 RepID=UPI003674894C
MTVSPTAAARARTAVPAAAYATAEALLRHNRGKLVVGGRIRPVWTPEGDRFWYTVGDGEGGRRFVVADPGAGTRTPAFDHDRLAAALTAASGVPADARALPFEAIELAPGAVVFDTPSGRWRCDLATYDCEPAPAGTSRGFLEVAAPDGAHTVFLRDHDLWLRSTADGRERALTTDGGPDHEYGLSPFTPLVLLKKLGMDHLPPAVAWSPDGRRILTHRTDQREVRETHVVAPVAEDGGGPELITQRYAYPGDETLPTGELVVIDTTTGEIVRAQDEPLLMPLMSPVTTRWAWWSDDGTAVYFLRRSRDVRTLDLCRLDPVTGAVRTLVTESGPTRVDPAQQQPQAPMVRVLGGGTEAVWYSQRDGWGHLYLYDTGSGAVRGRITSGEWAVQEILRIDEATRTVYFVASGLVAGHPYRRTVCRAGLDGGGFARITDDGLDHVVTVAPNADCFIDSASTTGIPPVITVRGWDGRVRAELERADITRLTATGWSPPEPFVTKAADGVTDVHGVLYKPHGFDPARRYPVIDHPYPGPHFNRVSPAFDPGILGHDAEAVAALGFVVIAMDGRGTPGRDKAFHDVSYGRYEIAGSMDDHVAGIRQLAADRPWMDLDRVGVFGLSGGGYATVRAMADFPEFYKVGVSEAGNHEDRIYHAWWSETYDGPAAENDYARSSNVEDADRITGKLLLVHGGMDDNVHPHHTLRLADALIAADKDFDLLIVPRAEHAFFGYEHYVSRRRWDYLLRHLMGAEPPKGYRLTPVPLDGELIADIFG